MFNKANCCEIAGVSQDLIACSIKISKQEYMLWVLSEHRPASQRQAMIHLLQWGGNCLAILKGQQHKSNARLMYVESLVSSDNLEHCLLELCKNISQQFDCESVYLLNTGRTTVTSALSYPPTDVLPNSDLDLQLKKIRDESFAQQTLISFPSINDTPNFKREHQRFGQSNQSALCSVPFIENGNRMAVLLLQKKEVFTSAEIASISLLPNILNHALENRIKGHNEKKSAKTIFSKIANLRAIAIACMLFITLMIAGNIDSTLEIKAAAEVEGRKKQLIVAPHDGYIKEAFYRSGDTVKAGDILAQLDDLNLDLNKKQQLANMASLKSQYQAALSERDRVKLARIRAQMDRAQAELDIIDYQLSQQKLSAAFDGVVLQGDMSQRIGAPVKAAEVLYELAAIDDYKIALYVSEYDIAELTTARKGKIRFTAFPNKVWGFSLLSLHPVSEIRDQKNVFRIEAKLDDDSNELKPGLRGYAQITTGEHSLLWVWTRNTITRMRLWFWQGAGW
ncbi:efflux RND transporter periplasmic adaptor subunit [uncultured Pseudoteredinibacter sp.]|uniref:efflux RND transporter periplasmic adaptor subunit n=1 Tax=uncultured Pseudoteredinibacter sp. TaxID=1641701 RepID=UPI002602F6E6|nr:efflux RND transporter periplasmic adaptor subunit [uncultured Pseudoteredinibacter sp.]